MGGTVKILIVNDSAVLRELVMRTLRAAGSSEHEFVEASTGSEALSSIAQESPGLILCDWQMPEMSGIETLRALREQDLSIPFCFVTAEFNSEMRIQATDSGAFAFLTKPFTPNSFKRVLGEILR